MFEERAVRADGVQLELALRSPSDWRLACRRRGRLLVEFSSARRHAFTSVEKLRYEFEQAVAHALRQA